MLTHVLIALVPGLYCRDRLATSVILQNDRVIVTWSGQARVYSLLTERKWQDWNAQLLLLTHYHTSNFFYHEKKCMCACVCLCGGGSISWRETKKLTIVEISSQIFKVKKNGSHYYFWSWNIPQPFWPIRLNYLIYTEPKLSLDGVLQNRPHRWWAICYYRMDLSCALAIPT